MASTDKDTELVEVFDVGFDRRKRRIYFGVNKDSDSDGEVCWKSIDDCIRQMHILIKDNSKKPIEIHASSPGGDTLAMFRLIDEIEACPCKVIFIGGGLIASAMTWIMAVCDERHVHKTSQILLHHGEEEIKGTSADVSIEAAHSKIVKDKLNQIFADNSVMPKDFWDELLQRDVYITPEEAVTLGLADRVIRPKKRGNLRRSRIALMNQARDEKDMRKLVRSMFERTERKRLKKIELSIPKEYYDPDVVVEANDESLEPLKKVDHGQEGSNQ